MLWSKIHLAQKVRIQMKQSATHWICDDEEWIEGRLKEIGRSSQDGATSRCISSAPRFMGLGGIFLYILIPFRNERA